MDRIPRRLQLAHELGAVDVALNPDEGSPAEAIKAQTGGRGADVCLERLSGVLALSAGGPVAAPRRPDGPAAGPSA